MGRQGELMRKEFSIGDIEELTQTKAHILRYWEEIIPSIAPKKNISGRRVYTEQDLFLLLRLKHLVQDKKYTLEGARNKLIEEASDDLSLLDENGRPVHIPQSFNELRTDLIELFLIVKKHRKP